MGNGRNIPVEDKKIHLVDKRLMCKTWRIQKIVGSDDINAVTCEECLEFAVDQYDRIMKTTRRKLYNANMRLKAIQDEQRRANRKAG